MSLELHTHTHTHPKDLEKFLNLHNKKTVRALDKAVTAMGLLAPLAAVPQVWEIYTTKSGEGNSLVMWAIWNVISIFWIIYGIAHKSKPLIIVQGAWLIIQTLVIIGILAY